MAAFGANQHQPNYIGGGDLWHEPEPPRQPWWWRLLAAPETVWLAIAVCLFFVGLTFWLS